MKSILVKIIDVNLQAAFFLHFSHHVLVDLTKLLVFPQLFLTLCIKPVLASICLWYPCLQNGVLLHSLEEKTQTDY